MTQTNQLGLMIRGIRTARGPEWTVDYAASLAGIVEGTWRLYEKGYRSVGNGITTPVNYQARTLRKIADALGVDAKPLLALAAQAPMRSAEAASEVVRAILDDPFLLPEAREHLVKQYGLLVRVQPTPTPDQQAATVTGQGITDIRNRPKKKTASKATPKRRTSD